MSILVWCRVQCIVNVAAIQNRFLRFYTSSTEEGNLLGAINRKCNEFFTLRYLQTAEHDADKLRTIRGAIKSLQQCLFLMESLLYHGREYPTMVEVDLELDLKGMNCPLPLLKAKQGLKQLRSGQVLRVQATDPGSVRDFRKLCPNQRP